ncbi:hypothetical protein, variant 2 [Aphanomyces astaci]|nr:hypothetical protein, variant 2 [Aphanomyces astaci]ETV85676.1 hypothetical protein, variant 2 [Aphanomyces astaci]|eukprot:XP_009824147.1 hypothetical protein, variant 2 [Aphanomyces astaci]
MALKPRRMVTQHTGNETHVQFTNGCAFHLLVYWVDGDGRQHQYHDVAPGASVVQQTYAGHVWHLTHETESMTWHRAVEGPHQVTVLGIDLTELVPWTLPDKPDQDASDVADAADAATDNDDLSAGFNVVHGGIQLTFDGTPEAHYDHVTVSPNGEYIACLLVVEPASASTYTLTLVEHCGAPKPTVQTHKYPQPGDDMRIFRPFVVHIASKTCIPVSTLLCDTPYDVTGLTWHPSSDWFSFLYNPRGHGFLRIVAVHVTGDTRVLLEDTSPSKFILHTKHYMHFLPCTHELLWISERSGYRHLYLYNVPASFHDMTELVGLALTSGPYVVRKVVDVNETSRTVTLAVSGFYPHQDPYYIHVLRLHLDTHELVPLTKADGFHRPLEYSADGSVYLDRYSRVDMAPCIELRRSVDGSLVCVLEQGNYKPLQDQVQWQPPSRFACPGRDGVTLIFGLVVFPIGYDFETRLRVVEHIYAGPHGAHVPKAFGLHLEMQQLAELGFAVVQVDGMGTAHRSKAFHDVCFQNIRDAGFPDRKLWLESLAVKFPSLDLSTGGVGIYGGSAGGQNAVAGLFHHGDMYSVAVADCGCHDNRVDKLWWNELWMGHPFNDQLYAANANATYAHHMQPHQHLQLTVGMLDANVDPACTFQLVQALIDADKDVDVVVFPKLGHGAGGSAYGTRKRWDFFVQHLQGNEPRHSTTKQTEAGGGLWGFPTRRKGGKGGDDLLRKKQAPQIATQSSKIMPDDGGDRKHDVFGDGTPCEGDEVDIDNLPPSLIASVEAGFSKPKRRIPFNPTEGEVHARESTRPWRLDGHRKLLAANHRAEEEQWEKRRLGLAKQVHEGLLHNYNIYVGISEVGNVIKLGQDQRRQEQQGLLPVHKDIAASAILVAAEKYDLARIAVLLDKVPKK